MFRLLFRHFYLIFMYLAICNMTSAVISNVAFARNESLSANIRIYSKKLNATDTKSIQTTEDFQTHIKNNKEDHLLFFFASWCEFCQAEMKKYLSRAKTPCQRITFISVDDNETDLMNYLKQIPKFNDPVYLDAGKKLRKRFKVNRLPTVAYFNKKGKLIKIADGADFAEIYMKLIISDGEGRNAKCI